LRSSSVVPENQLCILNLVTDSRNWKKKMWNKWLEGFFFDSLVRQQLEDLRIGESVVCWVADLRIVRCVADDLGDHSWR
jgi:hypothetical protein